jgi:hypothetical protein
MKSLERQRRRRELINEYASVVLAGAVITKRIKWARPRFGYTQWFITALPPTIKRGTVGPFKSRRDAVLTARHLLETQA